MENIPDKSPKSDLVNYNGIMIERDELKIIEALHEEVTPQRITDFLGQTFKGIGIGNGHICQLHLHELKQFPRAILSCRYLEDLELDGNLDTIPSKIGELKSLKTLFLRLPKLKALPDEIGNLYNLRDLQIYFLESISNLPSNLGQLANMEIFMMKGLHKITSLPESLGNWSKLQKFVIETCRGLERIPASLRSLKNVVRLKIENLPNLETMAWLEGLENLVELDLRTLPKVQNLPAKIAQGRHLKEVDIHQVPLTDIPASLGECDDIERLVIKGTSLKEIPKTFESLHNLNHFSVGDNQIVAIQGNYEHLQRLDSLNLSNNKLGNLPRGIENCKNLHFIDARKNQLRTLPENIGNCTALGWLSLEDNRLSTLPESIGRLQSLNRLELKNNELTSLPESFGNLRHLGLLNVNNNRLTRLPASFVDMDALRFMNVGGNPWEFPFDQMVGMKPDEFRAILKQYYMAHPEQSSSRIVPSEARGATPGVNGAPDDAEGVVQVVYGYVIPKKGSEALPCLTITTRRFWDEQRRVPEMGEWESRYFPEELATIEHVVDALGDDEIVEGIYTFHASTPDGEARQTRALALWGEQKLDELFLLHGEIVEKDLKPSLEKLGAVEVPQISEHLRRENFSQ